MAHLHIEYSEGVENRIDAVARAGYEAMLAAGIFPVAGIRVRAFKADVAIVADDHSDNAFLAMTLSVGAGRSEYALKAAGDEIFTAVQDALADVLAAPHFALSLEIREINPNLSWKDTPIHARLSARQ